MRYLLRSALLAPLLSLTFACNKVDFGPDEGYTARDNYNQPIGAADETDWTSDTDWNKKEQDLFKDSGVDLSAAQPGAGMLTLSLWPNPAAEMATFNVLSRSSSNPAPMVMGMAVVVDKKYRVLQEFPLRSGYSMKLDLPADKFKDKQLYRLYYIWYDATSNALYLKGHGDIKIKR